LAHAAVEKGGGAQLADDMLAAIQAWSSQVLHFAVLLAAVGTITMAFLELLKALTRARLWFHKRVLERWIDDPALSQLLVLSAGSSEDVFGWYDQPDERLMATLQSAANVALNYPLAYPDLYAFLTAGSGRADAGAERSEGDAETWRKASKIGSDPVPDDEAERATFLALSRQGTDARARLGNLAQRKLDSFASRIDYVWSRLNQSLAVIVGTVLFYWFISSSEAVHEAPGVARWGLAVLGGLVAPFAKDVVSALSGLGSSSSTP
jgi:hypothetical protein